MENEKDGIEELLTLAKQLPANLRSDWDGSNHYELQDSNPYGDWFWAMLADGLPLGANNCESEYGKRIGLVMDCVAMLSKLEVQSQIAETATLTARVKELEAAIDAEPELPDEMPDEMWDAICGIVDVRDRPTMQELLRITVRTTKQGIKDRAKELLDR